MNKHLFLSLSILTLLTLLVLNHKAEAQTSQAVFLYQPDTGSIAANSNLSLDFRVNSSSAITSVVANLIFDPTRLSVASIDSSESSFQTQWEQTFDNTAGTISIQRSTPSPGASGDKLIAKITFQAKSTAGNTTLAYHTNCFLAGNPTCLALTPDNTNILASGSEGTFTIVTAPTPTATLTPTPAPTSAPSSGGGGGGSSGGGGGGGSSGKSADLNGDGKVNIFDLSILLRNWGRSGQGDLNGDGKVNIFDLSILLRGWTR